VEFAPIAAPKREVLKMEESITYQEIVGIGAMKEARKLILRQGKNRFGRTSRKAAQALEAITDLGELEGLFDRLNQVNSWDEFLAGR
jgi:phosphate uptake regulator